MSEELLYNSGRPRRTRSMTTSVTPVNPNPYKKPTYLAGRSNNGTPDDSPDEGSGETPSCSSSSRGRRKPGRPFGSLTKNKSSPLSTPAETPRAGSGGRRGRGRGGTNGSSRAVQTPTPQPVWSSRKRGSTSIPTTWTGKSRPECVVSRNDRKSGGGNRSTKKKRRGYNSTDYHYGSDFESDDQNESEPEEVVPSESESVEDTVDDDMPLDEPLESDSDLSEGSARLQGLPSIPVPIWLDPEATVEELEIPRSSDDLLLSRDLLIDAIGIYEPLRRFSNLVRLTPFRFEDFCAAISSEEQSVLLAEIHIQLLKALIREDEVTGTSYGPNECKDSMQSVLFFADNMTWAECLRAYLESDPGWSDIYTTLTSVEYPFCGPEIRIKVLSWLIDFVMVSNSLRDLLALEGKIQHEDYCRACNRLGELICCETCPAVYHLGCISLGPGNEDPPDDWKCPICEHHELLGVSDCVSEIEKAGLLLRQETLGYDRHGRKYWFLVRRLLVESDDKSEVWYYSTRLQVEELLFRLDPTNYEKTLVENILYHKEEIFRQMGLTENITQKMNTNHRKTYLEMENLFLTRILEERELIRGQEEAEKLRIEDQARVSIRKQLEEKQRQDEEERLRKEEEKRKIREERLAKRNQIKLKERLGKIPDIDESLEQFLLNEESKDSFTDDYGSRRDEESCDTQPGTSGLDNGVGDDELPPTLEPETSQEVKMEVDVVEEVKPPALEVKLEPKDIEPLVKASILPKIAAKSKSLNLEVDSEERVTRLRATGLYKLGQEGNFRSYVNSYSSDVLALSKSQHIEERDKRRTLSHKFSLTQASECKWSGQQQGSRTTIVATLRQTLLNMEVAIPTTLMHCNWILLRKAWIAGVSGCGTSTEFSKALLTFAACLRPSVFNPIWSEGTGHVKLSRTSSIQKELRKKAEKAEKKFRDDEEDRLKLLPQFVKYSLPPKHQVWKQKGEEFRTHGNWGWIWLSNFRPAKPKDSSKMGLLRGPHKHVIQVKGNAGKVKTMLIDPEVYNKLMAKRSVPQNPPTDNKKLDPLLSNAIGQVRPKKEQFQEEDQVTIVESILQSLVDDVVEERQKPRLTSHLHKVQVKVEPELKVESQVETKTKSGGGVDDKGDVTCGSSPSRKFRTELINVSLGIVSANRILYPKIAPEVPSLDSLLGRRIKAQAEEEKSLLEEFGVEILDAMKGPPPVLDKSPIHIKVDSSFPLGGGYALTCFSYECQKAARDGKLNFEATCYSPMCRLKSVIMASRTKKIQRERLAEFEKNKKARQEIESKRNYNQTSTSEKVHLKKPAMERGGKSRDLVKYPLTSKFQTKSSKKPTMLLLPQHELSKLARSGARTMTPAGFAANPKPNTWLWPYPSGRPFFKTSWQYRTVHTKSLHGAAFNLRLLYASVRWDDIQMKPLNPEGKSTVTTDMEVITSEILDHRIVGRFLEVYQYLRRRHVVPIDAPKTVMRGTRETNHSEVTPSRSGLRKRKRAESPLNSHPLVREEWVDEDKIEVWEIKLYGEKLERKNDKKPEPPSSSTRTKTGVTLRIPDKWDPSPKESKEKEIKETTPSSTRFLPLSALKQEPEVMESEMSPQRIVHLSKRDNHPKITTNPNKVPTPTASQQLIQQQQSAAAAAAAANQGLPPGTSPITRAVTLTQATSANGRKFFVTRPTVGVGMGLRPSSPTLTLKEKAGILKRSFVSSPVSSGAIQKPETAVVGSIINSTATIGGNPPQIKIQAEQPSPVTNQKFQVLRSEDGNIRVKGLLPGQTAYQTPDGRVHVICPSSVGDEKVTGNVVSPAANLLRSQGAIQLMGTPSAPPTNQPRVNISNPAIRTVLSRPGTIPLVRPVDNKPAVLKAIPPQVITVNRTAEDLKDNPLHLQTARGIIQVQQSNVTRNASGQDQIFLGPGLPIIQLLPPRTQPITVIRPEVPVEPPPLHQPPPPSPSLLPQGTVTRVVGPVQQQIQIPTTTPVTPEVSAAGGSRIVYTDGNRSFILKGYSEAQVGSLITQLQQKRIIIKGSEVTSPSIQISQPTNQLGLTLPNQIQQPQQIILQTGQVVSLAQTPIPSPVLVSSQEAEQGQKSVSQQIATVGGQKVFIRASQPLIRSVTPVGGSPGQVFQKLQPTSPLTSPVPVQQYGRGGQGIMRTPLPISIVSPSKPRTITPTTPIRLPLPQPTTDSTSPVGGHPGIMTSQQLTGLLQRQTPPTTLVSTPLRPLVQSPTLVMSPRLPTILRSVTPVVSPPGSQMKNKVTAQVIQTSVGPRLMVQGLPSKLSPAVLAQLEAQLTKQLSGGGLAGAGIPTSPPPTTIITTAPTTPDVTVIHGTLSPQSKGGKKRAKSPSPKRPTGTSRTTALVQAEEGVGDINDSIETAIGGLVENSGLLSGRMEVKEEKQRSPSPKKRKITQVTEYGEMESEARFILSQDLVTQSTEVTEGDSPRKEGGDGNKLLDQQEQTSVPTTVQDNNQLPPLTNDLGDKLEPSDPTISPSPPIRGGGTKVSRRKSPVRSEASLSAKASTAAHHKLLNNVHKHKELLKKDIFKRRALLEKDLLLTIHAEVAEEQGKLEQIPTESGEVDETGGKSPKKETFRSTLKTTKGRSSLPLSFGGKIGGRRSKARKKGLELHCICQTPYDKNKFYVGCDKCDKWYHGECIGITEELSQCLSDYICDPCQNVKLWCICQQPYDDTQFYIGCDKCEDWLHGRCVGVIPLEGPQMDQYVCPNCDPNTPHNRVNMRKLTDNDYPHLEKVVKQLQAHKSSGAFREPVDASEAPNYFRVIKEPMDLQTIESRVDQKCYVNLREFVGDITKIFDNCRYFNQPESQFCKSANVLEKFFAQKVNLLRQQLSGS